MNYSDLIDDAKFCIRQWLHPLADAHLAMTCRAEALARARWFETHLSGPRNRESYLAEILRSESDMIFSRELQRAFDAKEWDLLLRFVTVALLSNRRGYNLATVLPTFRLHAMTHHGMQSEPVSNYIRNGLEDAQRLADDHFYAMEEMDKVFRLLSCNEAVTLLRICLTAGLVNAISLVEYPHYVTDHLDPEVSWDIVISALRFTPHLLTLPIVKWFYERERSVDIPVSWDLPVESLRWLRSEKKWSPWHNIPPAVWSRHFITWLQTLGSTFSSYHLTSAMAYGDLAAFRWMIERPQLRDPGVTPQQPFNVLSLAWWEARTDVFIRWLQENKLQTTDGLLLDPKTRELFLL